MSGMHDAFHERKKKQKKKNKNKRGAFSMAAF